MAIVNVMFPVSSVLLTSFTKDEINREGGKATTFINLSLNYWHLPYLLFKIHANWTYYDVDLDIPICQQREKEDFQCIIPWRNRWSWGIPSQASADPRHRNTSVFCVNVSFNFSLHVKLHQVGIERVLSKFERYWEVLASLWTTRALFIKSWE